MFSQLTIRRTTEPPPHSPYPSEVTIFIQKMHNVLKNLMAVNFIPHHIAFGRCGRSKWAFWASKNKTFFKSDQICKVDWN